VLIQRTDPETIPRDRWERPEIDGVAYTRASTIAKTLDRGDGLITWTARVVARGMATRPDLVKLAYAHRNDDKKLAQVAAQAKEAGGGSSARSTGTALHAVLEELDRGELDLADVPDDAVRERAESYLLATKLSSLTTVGTEFFTFNERFRAAGTADRAYLCGDGRVRIGDLKTGNSDTKWLLGPTALQLAVYATGVLFDGEPWPENFDPTIGLLVHVPQSGGPVSVVELDLVHALVGVELCCDVREWRDTHMSYVTLT